MYNVAAYVGECFQSLLGQTEGDFEVVAIDDGSTDNTFSMATSAAQGDGRFRFFQQMNRGQSAARNFGIDQAQGEFLLFLDADDYYRADALETLARHARENDLDYLDFGAHTFYEGAYLRRTRRDDYDGRSSVPGVMPGTRLFAEYQRRREYYCSPCLHYFKRSLLESGAGVTGKLRFDEGHIHEDELFSPLLLERAHRAAFLNEPLYFRRVHKGSSMTREFGIHNVHGTFASSQKLQERLLDESQPIDAEFADALAQRVFEVRELLAGYIDVTPNDQIDEYARGLSRRDRADFQQARSLSQLLYGLYRSHTFKVGSALVAGPSWAKRQLERRASR